MGAAIRHYRTEAGLSQAQLAEIAGLNRTYLSNLESGKETQQIRRILRVPPSWGLPRQRCEEIVADILDRAPDAIGAARDETAGGPDSIVSAVEGQLVQLRSFQSSE